ncbi:unnamed protein product, partial [Durusdinium trenchii]
MRVRAGAWSLRMVQLTLAVAHGLKDTVAEGHQAMAQLRAVWDLQMTSDLKVSDRVQPLYKLLWSDNSQRLRGSIS